jgi:hypothetical protein
MAETAAHLVDRVLPAVPMRQWVLSLPFPLRYRLAYDRTLSTPLLAAFLRAVRVRIVRDFKGPASGHQSASEKVFSVKPVHLSTPKCPSLSGRTGSNGLPLASSTFAQNIVCGPVVHSPMPAPVSVQSPFSQSFGFGKSRPPRAVVIRGRGTATMRPRRRSRTCRRTM